jgi:hypothetical protein
MSYGFSSLMFRAARLQGRLQAELLNSRPDRLTLLRLRVLLLRIGHRLHGMPPGTLPA